MHDFELQAFVTNLGKYNEGELVGEWVSFPVTPEELRAVLYGAPADAFRLRSP